MKLLASIVSEKVSVKISEVRSREKFLNIGGVVSAVNFVTGCPFVFGIATTVLLFMSLIASPVKVRNVLVVLVARPVWYLMILESSSVKFIFTTVPLGLVV